MKTEEYLKALSSIKYWGAATSAHQVEGKNHNQWSVWELANAKELANAAESKYAHWLPAWELIKEDATDPNNYVSGIADDQYRLYESDFQMLKDLNMNAYRFSVEWSRIEPQEGQWNEAEIAHYKEFILSLNKLGIEPIVTLWHWTIPVWFSELGGFAKSQNIKYFERFCVKLISAIKGQVKYVYVLNEPNVYTSMSYFTGEWPPMRKSYLSTLVTYNNLARAHRRVYDSLKSLDNSLIIGHTQNMICAYPGDQSPLSRLVARVRHFIWNWWFINRIKSKLDYIGINYYLSDRVYKFRVHNPNLKQNDMGWNMEPEKIEYVLKETYRRYNLPIMVTENGVADSKDQYRSWWIEGTLRGIANAIKAGVDIKGYLHWSLLDNFEWDKGFWPRFGLIEVDRKTLKRNIRPSAKHYAKIIRIVRSHSENH